MVGRLRYERRQAAVAHTTALSANMLGVCGSDPHPARLAAAIMALLQPQYQSRIEALEEHLVQSLRSCGCGVCDKVTLEEVELGHMSHYLLWSL